MRFSLLVVLASVLAYAVVAIPTIDIDATDESVEAQMNADAERMAKEWKINQAKYPEWQAAVQQAADNADLDLAQQGWGTPKWVSNAWNKAKAAASNVWHKVKSITAKAIKNVKHWAVKTLDDAKTAVMAKLNKFIGEKVDKFAKFMKGKTYNCATLKSWVNDYVGKSAAKHATLAGMWNMAKPLLNQFGDDYICKPFETLICKEGPKLAKDMKDPELKKSLEKVRDTIDKSVKCKKLIELLDIEPQDHPAWVSFVASHDDFSNWKDAWNAKKAAYTEAIQTTEDTWAEHTV
jgi:hypothetical protein